MTTTAKLITKQCTTCGRDTGDHTLDQLIECTPPRPDCTCIVRLSKAGESILDEDGRLRLSKDCPLHQRDPIPEVL